MFKLMIVDVEKVEQFIELIGKKSHDVAEASEYGDCKEMDPPINVLN